MEGQGNVESAARLEAGARLREPTERGQRYQYDTTKRNLKSSLKAYKRKANQLRTILSGESEEENIKDLRDSAQKLMDEAIGLQEKLEALAAALGEEDNGESALDDAEDEHNELMRQTLCTLVESRSPRSRVNSVRSKAEQAEQADLAAFPVEASPISTIVAQQMRASRLPLPEPDIFSGDPLLFPGWKNSIDLLLEESGVRTSDRFFFLKKYLSGEPLELVKGYAMIASDEAYNQAKAALNHRYGNRFTISNAFRDKLDNWPRISTKDSAGLRRLGDFLRQCEAAMEQIGSLQCLNDERENRKLLSKLPDWMIARWSRKVIDWIDHTGADFPPFRIFSKFVQDEARIACFPATADLHSPSNSRPESKKQESRKHESRKQQNKARGFASSSRSATCSFCKGEHRLDNCKLFLSEDNKLADRKKFVLTNGLCYGCLKPGHRSKECRGRSTCSSCKGRHPTSLHDPDWKPKDDRCKESNSNATHCDDKLLKTSAIVPVWLSHQGSKELLVYAMLDTQSDSTFILDDVRKGLGAAGTPVNLILSTLTKANTKVSSQRVNGLTVRGFNSSNRIKLPPTYSRNVMPANRNHIPTPDLAASFAHLKDIADLIPPLQDCQVGLLIGFDCPRALVPKEIIPSPNDGPFGMKTTLGWSIVGSVGTNEEDNPNVPVGICHKVTVQTVSEDVQLEGQRSKIAFAHKTLVKEEIISVLESDFTERHTDGKPYSQLDTRFMEILDKNVKVHNDGHYETPLPFIEDKPCLPNNRALAFKRIGQLKRKFVQDPEYHKTYTEKMAALVDSGYAEIVPEPKPGDPVWYIPHHGVRQPNKLRVVFDCSASFKGESLNAHLLTGPDLTNALAGVLCRFRLDQIAFSCDVKEMFYQFRVREDHRDFFRFLWWKDGDYSQPLQDMRATVHLFGASSSPGCSNFCLKRLASDKATEFGDDVKNFIHNNFYVDDGLKSVSTPQEAIDLIARTKEMCKEGGLHLHKFISNSKEVLSSIPPEDVVKDAANVDLLQEHLPMQRALGVKWCLESDTFQFRLTLDDKPLTRRGILSTVMSVYDPLGLISPIVLKGKEILQDLCKSSLDWDDPLPDELRTKWEKWRSDLPNLEILKIKRCYMPQDFGKVKLQQLHHFADASSSGYGQCTYLRSINEEGQVHCTLVMGKSRVAPLKPVTIPRLELTAAVVAVNVGVFVEKELAITNIEHFYWTDSQVVLGYINNDSKRFHVFVANRIRQIQQHSSPAQWRHVRSNENPADVASRGSSVAQLSTSDWLTGPSFLWDTELTFPVEHEEFTLQEEDAEVKRSHVHVTQRGSSGLEVSRLEYFSSWLKARRAIAYCHLFLIRLKQRCHGKRAEDSAESTSVKMEMTVDDLKKAEMTILKAVQDEAFHDEMETLKAFREADSITAREKKRGLKRSNRLCSLDAFLDKDQVLRVGGRLKHSTEPFEVKHPVILPQNSHVTALIIQYCHQQVAHQGRGMTVNRIRANGYWIIGCSNAVSKFIRKCVTCRKLRSPTQTQKMADLPKDRVEPATPFEFSGMDCFGPWLIREGRKELKRYGLVFTCMSCRAVHIETLHSLSTDSFINALRRFLSIRGPVRQLRSDQGTNFVGAKAEFTRLMKTDHDRVRDYLMKENCDYITFNFNVPTASHMGGSWERQIGTIRRVLDGLMHHAGPQLDDESLRTLMCETAAIVNSRPLTIENVNDPTHPVPLTPNHLLTTKTSILLPPPGNFVKQDLYSRKRWRRVQHLVNEFWNRWKKEFLQNLQSRQKWTHPQREAKVGDVVMLKDDNTPRCQWTLARIKETFPSSDGLVRKVKVAISDAKLNDDGTRTRPSQILERPVHKLVTLLPVEEQCTVVKT